MRTFEQEGFSRIFHARERQESFFTSHTFDNVTNGSVFKVALEVQPGETMYIHFAKLHFTNVLQDSAYKITSFNGELTAITGGSTPDTDVNEITGDTVTRATISVNETAPFTVPFDQNIVKAIEITQGASTFIDFAIDSSNTRDLVNIPIILNNISLSNKYILLQGNVEDLLNLAASNNFSVTFGVFYSIC